MRQKKMMKGLRPETGFLAFLKSESEHQYQMGHICNANNYVSAEHSFRRFLQTFGQNDVPFEQVTALLVNDYEAWLQTCGLCKNTSSFYLRSLQSVYNKAVQQDRTADRHPFKTVYRGVARTVKRAISPDDLYRLCSLDIRKVLIARGYQVGTQRFDHHLQPLEFARDMFLFCFCARGLTFVDLAFMRKSDIASGMMTYVRRKTKQRIEVKIEPMMQAIIDRYPSTTSYLFPIMKKTGDSRKVYYQYRYAITRYNSCLNQLGEMLGLVKLTSYVSRHSWATTARKQNVPLPIISQSMGHDSEKTTEIYLKSLESNIIHQTNGELLNHVFHTHERDKNGNRCKGFI